MTTIRRITQDELDNFGLDEHDQLYWRTNNVYHKLRLALPRSIDWSARLIAGGAVVSAIVQVAEAFHHWAP
jgi:hypothetical protein